MKHLSKETLTLIGTFEREITDCNKEVVKILSPFWGSTLVITKEQSYILRQDQSARDRFLPFTNHDLQIALAVKHDMGWLDEKRNVS